MRYSRPALLEPPVRHACRARSRHPTSMSRTASTGRRTGAATTPGWPRARAIPPRRVVLPVRAQGADAGADDMRARLHAPSLAELGRDLAADAIFLGEFATGSPGSPSTSASSRRLASRAGRAAQRRLLLPADEAGAAGLCPRPRPLASGPPLLRLVRRADRGQPGRPCPPLPRLRPRQLPAHRSRRDRAGHPRRPLPARPLAALPARHVLDPGRLRGARRVAGETPCAARCSRRSAW